MSRVEQSAGMEGCDLTATARLEVRYSTAHGAAVVVLGGEHDLSTALRLTQTLRQLARSGCAVVVDLSDTSFIDSSIVNALVDGRAAMEQANSSLRIVLAAGSQPRRVADLLGLPASFVGYATLDEALAPLEPGGVRDVVWQPRSSRQVFRRAVS